jgi:Mce-associated membrane protein
MNPTLYDILGVSPDASREEIRKAWREAADRFEPGEGGSTKQFRLFNEAAEVLLDPERRKEYDGQLPGKEVRRQAAETAEAVETKEPPSKVEASAVGDKAPVADEKTPVEGDEAPVEKDQQEKGSADDEGRTATATIPGPPIPGAAQATSAAAPGAVGLTKGEAAEGAGGGGDPAGARDSGPGEPARSDGSSRVGRIGSWPVLAVLGVLAAAAVGFAAYFVTQAQRAEAYQEALDRAPAAAESAASAVLSYDYKTLDADRDAAAKFLSKDYRQQYLDTFDKTVAEAAPQLKATVEAQVLASAPMVVGEERDPDRVSVLVFVDQTTTSAAKTESTKAMNRAQFDMVRVDGTWLVGDITSY